MGAFNLNFSLPGLGIDAKKIQEALASYSARNAATGVPSARDFAPVVPGAGTVYVPPTPSRPVSTPSYSSSSGPLTDEARMEMERADAENRQALRDAGVNVEGLTPAQYNAAIEAFGEWRNRPENRAYRNTSSAIGRFVDSIGGPAGLFGLTVGALTGGLGYAGMLGSMGAGAAAGAVTGAVSGDPLRAGLAGAAGGVLGSGANALLGGPTQGVAAAGTTTPAAAVAPAAPSVAPTAAVGTTTPAAQAVAAAPVAAPVAPAAAPAVAASAPTVSGGTSAINIAAGTGAVSPAAGSINLAATGMPAFAQGATATGAGTLGGIGTAIVAPSAPLTMAGLTGATSPAAGTVNALAGLPGGSLAAAAPAVSATAPITATNILGGAATTGGMNTGLVSSLTGQAAQNLTSTAAAGGTIGLGSSPAAGAINLGAAGLGTSAAGGAGMGGISGLISGAQNLAGNIGNFLGSPLGQGLAQIGAGALDYLGGEQRADLARELAAQAQFRPYNVQGPLGAVTVQGQDISISPTEQQRAFQESLFGLGTGALGRAGAPVLQNIFARTPAQLQSLVQDYIGQETALPGQARALEQRLLGLGGTAESLGVQGIQEAFRAPTAADIISRQLAGTGYQALPSSLGMVSPFVGMAPGADMLSARGSISGLLGGAGPGATILGGGALRGALAPSREEGLVSQAAGAGLGFLAEGTGGARDITGVLAGQGGELLRGAAAEQPSFNQLAAERLAALRAQARPAEERTTQAALERLFGQGRLGTTGGARVLGELSRAQEEADIARITSAQDFAQTQQNVALENALRRGELGLSALGGALGGQQFLTGTGTGLLGMGAEVGQFGRSLGADVGLAGLRLGEEGRQADIASILSALGQDVSQRQFGAELSEQQRGLNLEALLAAQAQDIGQRQFGTTFGEQQRISNIDALLQAANLDQTRAARLGTLGAGLFGLGAGMPSSIFEAQRLADEARLARGAQRIAAAEGLFGFGQGARAGELGMGLDIMAGLRTQYDPLIQLANIASGMGSAQATAAGAGMGARLGAFNSPYTAASNTILGLLG